MSCLPVDDAGSAGGGAVDHSRTTALGLGAHHWARAGERQRYAGEACTRKALRERRRNEDRRFEARVCPERGGDGRQRRVRLRWSARWFVLHQRPGGENLAGKPLDFTGTEVIDDLLVVFTTEKAESEVTLTGLREVEVRVSR